MLSSLSTLQKKELSKLGSNYSEMYSDEDEGSYDEEDEPESQVHINGHF